MTTAAGEALGRLILSLPASRARHAPGTPDYARLKKEARREVEALFSGTDTAKRPFGPFGDLSFPYRRMGAIDSLDLFGLDELIIFSFYWANRNRYQRTIDIGANLGLHSLVMSRCGYTVRCYEPDPVTFAHLESNLKANGASAVTPVRAAVSDHAGKAEFIRLLGNTTGSHLAGAKKNPYGEMDKFEVPLESFGDLRGKADLFKIDAEGHEAVILGAADAAFWEKADALVEVGSPENADKVFGKLQKDGVSMYAQKLNWGRVEKRADMPTSYHDGTLFLTRKKEMPWQ